MANKGSSGTTTRTEVGKILQTDAERLSAREEKVLRMRTGAGIDAGAALPRRGTKSVETKAELTALEIELTRKLAERNGATEERALPASPVAKAGRPEHTDETKDEPQPQVRTRAKDKIIRALRRLK
jgi:hypothetical protein